MGNGYMPNQGLIYLHPHSRMDVAQLGLFRPTHDVGHTETMEDYNAIECTSTEFSGYARQSISFGETQLPSDTAGVTRSTADPCSFVAEEGWFGMLSGDADGFFGYGAGLRFAANLFHRPCEFNVVGDTLVLTINHALSCGGDYMP
jgi:hypothetical protein